MVNANRVVPSSISSTFLLILRGSKLFFQELHLLFSLFPQGDAITQKIIQMQTDYSLSFLPDLLRKQGKIVEYGDCSFKCDTAVSYNILHIKNIHILLN